MKSIYIKEIIQFFTSSVGYISMGLFFLLNSLFLWIINGGYNIPDNQFANLSPFFNLAPWILIFVISAVSMKIFAEEFKTGTIETLITKPLTNWQIVIGKYASVWFIGKIMLIPTIIYVISVQMLSVEGQSLDFGVVLSAYTGLVLLIGVFASMGLFASVLFSNQVNAFLVGLFLMFLFYFGFQGIGNFNMFGKLDLLIQNISLENHYQNMLKGLIKLSDIIYMFSLMFLFVSLTHFTLNKRIQ